jgi:hypothetical protein
MPRFLSIFKNKKSKPATPSPEKRVEPAKPIKKAENVENVKKAEGVEKVTKVEEPSHSKIGPGQTGSIIEKSTNPAFQEAWKQHWNELSENERLAWSFQEAQSPLQAQRDVEDIDKLHREQSVSRRIANRTLSFLQVVQSLMAGAEIGIQAYPEVSSIVVGVLRVVINVCNYFEKLQALG